MKDGVELLLEMFPACTVSQAEKALAMALGNLEEAVQLIVEEKVEIGPAGVSVKVLYSDLGGSGPRSRAELRDTQVPQLSATSRNFDCRNFLHDKPGGSCRATAPLPPLALLVEAVPTTKPGPQWSCGWHPLSHRGWGAPPAAGLTELADKLYTPVLCYSHTSLSPSRNWHGPAEHPTMRN